MEKQINDNKFEKGLVEPVLSFILFDEERRKNRPCFKRLLQRLKKLLHHLSTIRFLYAAVTGNTSFVVRRILKKLSPETKPPMIYFISPKTVEVMVENIEKIMDKDMIDLLVCKTATMQELKSKNGLNATIFI
ncbi:hypothetical protein YC2023_042264 [Brassica napus]